MERAGEKLKHIRERLKLTYREVERASQEIACKRGNTGFAIALSRRVAVVMSAIEFDDHSLCRTEEVDNIGTDWRLSPEVCALDW